VLQCLLFPGGHMDEDVPYRPISGHTGLHHLQIRQPSVRFQELTPGLFESC
jgi:hypothetical protein